MNRRLRPDELARANALLDLTRSRIDDLSGGDQRLRFAYNRKVAKELVYDERGKPVHRIRLKAKKRRSQQGMCANASVPPHPLPEKGAVLDRVRAEDGYTEANTQNGRPAWDFSRTLQLTDEADDILERQGLNPAPKFRAQRKSGNCGYVAAWVRGCRFPWLAPR